MSCNRRRQEIDCERCFFCAWKICDRSIKAKRVKWSCAATLGHRGFHHEHAITDVLPAPQTRKELTQGKVKDKHWNWGSLLLGLGVVIGIAGPINTYIRVGEHPSAPSTTSFLSILLTRKYQAATRLLMPSLPFFGMLSHRQAGFWLSYQINDISPHI